MKIQLTAKNGCYVETLSDARDVFLKWIAANAFGSSDLSRNAGLVTDNGRKVARVSYNGRIWTPEKWPTCKEIVLEPSRNMMAVRNAAIVKSREGWTVPEVLKALADGRNGIAYQEEKKS